MFMGPLDASKTWNDTGGGSAGGVHRFLCRVWRLFGKHSQSATEISSVREQLDRTEQQKRDKLLHATIDRVTRELEGLRFNNCASMNISIQRGH